MALKLQRFSTGSRWGYHVEVDGVVVGSVTRNGPHKWTPAVNSVSADPHDTLADAIAYVVGEASAQEPAPDLSPQPEPEPQAQQEDIPESPSAPAEPTSADVYVKTEAKPGESEQDRHFREADEQYPGPCPFGNFPPHPPTFRAISPYKLHVISEPMVLPDKNSWWSMESHMHKIEVKYFNEAEQREVLIEAGDRENSGTSIPDGGVFMDLFETHTLPDEFEARGKTCWKIQDSHPENRGFLVGSGKFYSGHWSEWSEWQRFENCVPVGRPPYSGPMTFFNVRIRTNQIFIDGRTLEEMFSEISGEWRKVLALVNRVVKLFPVRGKGREIERVVFSSKRGRKFYLEFCVPCNGGESVIIDCPEGLLGNNYKDDYRAVFDEIADRRFPGILAPADHRQDGATLTIK